MTLAIPRCCFILLLERYYFLLLLLIINYAILFYFFQMMSELNFRIVVVPKTECSQESKNKLLTHVTEILQNCSLKLLSSSYSNITKSAEDVHPEIEELIFQVHATVPKEDVSKYEFLCSKWKIRSRSLPCSYIMLYSNDSFMSSKRSRTQVELNTLSFGLLPHDGAFYEYASLNTSGSTIFYHNTRNVIIKYDNNF